ncbi:hypothetical protein JB92DRAFT_2889831 [Gautieria morchelliformis]|nr:hypothetical protein JB92DRAFT_2889831 [Gautieria morchelliformis]
MKEIRGKLSLEVFELKGPSKVPETLWQCSKCSHTARREGEMKRHIETHEHEPTLRLVCWNPDCTTLFARTDSAKRHLAGIPECRAKIPSGMTVRDDTPRVLKKEHGYTPVKIEWISGSNQ